MAAGASRAAASLEPLSELNPYVSVTAHAGGLDEATIRRFHVVVATDVPRAEQLRINAICRSHSPAIGFIGAGAWAVRAREG